MANLHRNAKKFLADNAAKIKTYAKGESHYKQAQIIATEVAIQKLVPMTYGNMAETEKIGLPQVDGVLKVIHKRSQNWAAEGLLVNIVAFRCEETFTAENGTVVPEGTIQLRVLQA